MNARTFPFLALLGLAFTLTAAPSLAQRAEGATPPRHSEAIKLGLSGYSPVSYHTKGRATVGSVKHKVEHEGITYLLADEEEMKMFKAEPEKFLPQFGGYCTTALAGGRAHRPQATCFKVSDEKLYLFKNEAAQKAFEEGDQKKIIKKASEGYKKVTTGGRKG